MRQLFILRHAQAAAAQRGETDFERRLTEKGQEDAKALGVYMRERKFLPEKIVISAAVRTQETFFLLNEALQISHAETRRDIYNADFDTLHDIVAQTDDEIKSLMIVGHNPGMHELAIFYANSSSSIIGFAPATLCVIEFETRWSDLQRHCGSVSALRMPISVDA